MHIPTDLRYDIDEYHWGKSFDPANETHHTEEIVSGYIACMLACYRTIYKNRKGEDLWQIFHEDFEGFTYDIFKLGHRVAVRELREQLVIQGVWVKGPRGAISYAKTLQECLDEDTPAEWTEEAINEKHKLMQAITTASDNQSSQNITQSPQQAQPALQPSQPSNHSSQHMPQVQPQQTHQQTHQPYAQILTPERDSTGTPNKLLTELMKIYNNDDKKYGGEEYDILDVKLQVFYDCCSKIGLPEEQYHNAYSIMLKERASNYYYSKIAGRLYDFKTMINLTKTHFETEENHQKYLSEWRETTLLRTISENPGKTRLECFQLTVDKLQKVQQGLTKEYQHEHNLRDQVINACRGVEECNLSLYKPAPTFEGVCSELRSAIGTAARSREVKSAFNTQIEETDDNEYEYSQHWTDRTYGGRGHNRGRGYRWNRGRGGQLNYENQRQQGNPSSGVNQRIGFQRKKCHVCDKTGCWSTKHTVEERRRAYEKFRQHASYISAQETTTEYYNSFLAQYEGIEGIDNTTEPNSDQFLSMSIEDTWYDNEHFTTELGEVDGIQTVSILNDQSAYHVFTKHDTFVPEKQTTVNSAFTFNDRYSSHEFHGIMPDSGAAGISSAGEQQVLALQRKDSNIQIDTTAAGSNTIRFGKGTATVKGVVKVPTPLGTITFHVVPTNTPFLFCLQDMDAMGVRFDNLKNILIQGNKIVPIVRKWGHPWMLLDQLEETIACCHLTETELRQLHRRFGHPSVQRLTNVLQRAGHDVDIAVIKQLTKFCH